MPPLYRALWGVTISAALHVAALHWGGAAFSRQSAPRSAPRETIQLALFQPPPETVPAVPAAPPAAPAKKPAPPTQPRREQPRPVEPVARVAPPPAPPISLERQVLPEPVAARANPVEPLAPPNPPQHRNGNDEPPRPNPPKDELAFPQQHPDQSALVSSVRDGIDAAKRYPRLARQAGWEGRVLLKFKLLRSGEVQELRVLETSGHPLLDDAAMNAVGRAAPFPEEGRKIAGDGIEVILPVVFQLR